MEVITEESRPKTDIELSHKKSGGNTIRRLKFTLTSIRANLKFVARAILRELKYFLPLQDLFILILMVIGIILIIAMFLLLLIPLIILLLSESEAVKFQTEAWRFMTDPTVLRWAAGIIGIATFVIRLMIKSPIMRFKDKVNTKKDVTYVFGSSRSAEQFLFEMVNQYGYEDKVALIADADLLWIRKLRSQMDIYIEQNLKEFEKPNLYETIGFANARRVMILSDSIELNQNILTHVRNVRPDIEIILLSQYAPIFVFSDLVKDNNLIVIEDLDMTIQGLVYSLSLDIGFPPTVEIDVPRTHLGATGIQMTSDLVKQKVLLIKRKNQILPPDEILKPGDRIIIYFYSNYYMKTTNRIVTELPYKFEKSESEIIQEDARGLLEV
ncbi:hypothetical protein [Candidatus Hodarchaeum mangrovi]